MLPESRLLLHVLQKPGHPRRSCCRESARRSRRRNSICRLSAPYGRPTPRCSRRSGADIYRKVPDNRSGLPVHFPWNGRTRRGTADGCRPSRRLQSDRKIHGTCGSPHRTWWGCSACWRARNGSGAPGHAASSSGTYHRNGSRSRTHFRWTT